MTGKSESFRYFPAVWLVDTSTGVWVYVDQQYLKPVILFPEVDVQQRGYKNGRPC